MSKNKATKELAKSIKKALDEYYKTMRYAHLKK